MKCGPKFPGAYYASRSKVQPTATELDFMRRRVSPFLDTMGLQTRPLETILCEVYMQGLRDAMEAQNYRQSNSTTITRSENPNPSI